jgi:nitrite reductase/ring-hydroxylating ferredoxin subunit
VLAGVGLVGLAGVITACGAGSSSSAPAESTAAGQGTSSAASSAAAGGGTSSAAAASSAASSAPAANALAATSAIPVGSGTVFTGPKVVVTQPTAGEFKAFSAVCTHMGCIVSQVSNGTIDCPCHGSQYNITTGAVVAGPAPAPLPAQQIKVSSGSIFLA